MDVRGHGRRRHQREKDVHLVSTTIDFSQGGECGSRVGENG